MREDGDANKDVEGGGLCQNTGDVKMLEVQP